MIPIWETTAKKELLDLKIFKAEMVTRKHSQSGKISEFVVLNSSNWANIIPITKDGNILIIEQFRQGTNSITLEIPGGLIEINEEPIEAARRECIEETGYSSDKELELLGISQPNPAFLNNKCYTYVWFDVEKKFIQNFDENEEINVIPTPINEVKQLIRQGKINHSIITTAFFYYFLKYGF